MNANHSSAKATYEYQPTIIESRLLIRRLAVQLAFLKNEFKRSWTDFKSDPVPFLTRSTSELLRRLKKVLFTPNAIPACLTAVMTVVCFAMLALLIERPAQSGESSGGFAESPPEVVMLNVASPPKAKGDLRIGKDGSGRAGLNKGTGEGSGPTPKLSRGGGGGGNRNPNPARAGKAPPPSNILAAIPIAPPKNPAALPVAGIVIDPALWRDLRAPVYGDPRSKSEIPSKGPGEGEGIGSNRGLGIGEGDGPGFGPGKDGNIGGGPNRQGCCGTGAGGNSGHGEPLSAREVEQRARLLFKPEPQYTEEARRNQITGTVMLRVVFSSSGEVVQIRAVRTLPFGLTERAIAAARQIKFAPAMKGGHAVSVHMQLEYNFNLY
jgi:TonB family protein